jgi:protein arginine N-methyltransferase 1
LDHPQAIGIEGIEFSDMAEAYTLSGYGSMIADRVRMEAYAEALRQSIHPGSVVVEIGTGPGIFAVLACHLGASRVYAIEPGNIIQVARDVAAANDCADRIEFIQEVSNRVTLPQQADVIVSDLRGVLPFYQHHIPAIADARRRFLAPGGAMIPRRDTVYLSVVEDPKGYADIVGPWKDNLLQQDLAAARRLAVNNFCKTHLVLERLLTPPNVWASLDYLAVEEPDFCGEVNSTVERGGGGHGFVAWFETELANGVGFSCGKNGSDSVYGAMFFPWPEPVVLTPGQSVIIKLTAKLVETDYVWRWDTCIKAAFGSGDPDIRFDQSQLAGALLSPASLRRASSDYVPQLSEEGRIDRRILELMDGHASLQEIAQKLMQEFPHRFTKQQDALTAISVLSRKYGT